MIGSGKCSWNSTALGIYTACHSAHAGGWVDACMQPCMHVWDIPHDTCSTMHAAMRAAMVSGLLHHRMLNRMLQNSPPEEACRVEQAHELE